MPRWRHPGQLILILALCLLGSAAFAQDAKPILVGFVEDRLLRTASITDNGIDGVSRLGEIFRQLGATTQLLRLDGPIPEAMDIVVLVRPSRPLSSAQMARLWLHLQHGKHLLLAIDPDYLAGVQPAAATSGLNRLLTLDYGLGMQNGTLLEPWFQLAQFDTALNLSAAAQAENFVQHPIIAPILHYDLPVRTWGAGNLLVDAFGTDSQADALLYTETAYGETDRNSLRGAEDAAPLGLNIGVDYQGRLLIGGVAVNTATGSRVALLGDSEIVENLYGLSRIANNSTVPLHPGNRILTERLVAWLMGLPEESWPALPEGLTWIALDGDASDWPADLPAVEDAILDAPENDLQSIQTFSNDQYVYVLLRAFKLKPDASLEFSAQDGQRLRQISTPRDSLSALMPTARSTCCLTRGSRSARWSKSACHAAPWAAPRLSAGCVLASRLRRSRTVWRKACPSRPPATAIRCRYGPIPARWLRY